MNTNTDSREQHVDSVPNDPTLDLFTDGDREYYKSLDAEQNRLSKPPEDVKVYFPSFWVFEAFTPSNIDNLKEGLKKRGIDEKIRILNRRDIIDELDALRSRSLGGGWFNIGNYSTNNPSPLNRLELSDGIQSVSIYLHQFVPSTTMMAFQFRLDEVHDGILDRTLRTNYRTKAVKKGRNTRFISPIDQKRDEYTFEKESLISIGTNWVANTFPGLFQSDLIGRSFPIVELILFKNEQPIKEKQNPYESYLTTIGFKSEFETYKSPDLPNIFMALDEGVLNKRSTMILSGNMDEIINSNETRGYGGGDLLFGISNWISTTLHKTLSFWCLSEVTYTFDHKIKQLRDELGGIETSNPQQALSGLRKIENEISQFQINALPFLYEIEENIDKRHFLTNIYEFKIMSDQIQQEKGLIEFRRSWIQSRAESMIKNNQHLDRASERLSGLISSQINLDLEKSNQKIQKLLVGLTIVAVTIAVFNFFDISWGSIVEIFRDE